MREILREYRTAFRIEFRENVKFENAEIRFSGAASEDTLQKGRELGLDENLIDFYKVTDGFKASWDYPLDLEGRIFGDLRILEIESIWGDDNWEEFFYSDGESTDIRLKHFKPIDYCSVSNMYCGLVLDGSGDQAMYYYDFSDADLLPLDIDFKSYFELAIDAKIMYGWQNYLVHQITPQNYIIDFPDKMKKLFPDFDLEAFTAKFESLRLSKRK